MITQKDKAIIQELAKETAQIAALPVQEEKRKLWRSLNGLKPRRPMVMIDQICWTEIDDDLLKMRCENEECRYYEMRLRRNLYQWKNFCADFVLEPFILVPKATGNTGFGIELQEETLVSDPNNPVVAHRWIDILKNDESVQIFAHSRADFYQFQSADKPPLKLKISLAAKSAVRRHGDNRSERLSIKNRADLPP